MIIVEGIQTNNLKNVDVKLPLGELIWVNGISGAGKSSLAVDTLYQLGKKQYLDLLGEESYRQLQVKSFEGLPPSICIQSQAIGSRKRSHLIHVLGIDKAFFALIQKDLHWKCDVCGKSLYPNVLDDFYKELCNIEVGSALRVLSPIQQGHTKEYLLSQGFVRIWKGEQEVRIEDLEEETPSGYVVIDRLKKKDSNLERLWGSLESALQYNDEKISVWTQAKYFAYSTKISCGEHGGDFDTPSWKHLSIRHQSGVCAKCLGMGELDNIPCSACSGIGISPKNLFLNNISLDDIFRWSIKDLHSYIKSHVASTSYVNLRQRLLSSLELCINLNLDYLGIFRLSKTLSSGEFQRLRLLRFLSQKMTSVLVVLDEPFAGLSPAEIVPLQKVLKQIVQLQNTILLVDHHPLTKDICTFEIKFKEIAGVNGGELEYVGPLQNREPESLEKIHFPLNAKSKKYTFTPVRNLKFNSITLPMKGLVGVSGCSGSGKSTLLSQILHPLLPLSKLISVKDQVKSDRGTIGTYLKFFNKLRDIFAKTNEARVKGYNAGRFSTNTPEGRCAKCLGKGYVVWNEIPEVITKEECSLCHGSGFHESTLKITVKGKNIFQWHNLAVEEAYSLTKNLKPLQKLLQPLLDLGMGYLKINQRLKTLSSGELQRLRLAEALLETGIAKTILMDEPTRGLHALEVKLLLRLLANRVRDGWLVVVVEHNPYFLEDCPLLWTLGPQAGVLGGELTVIEQ